LSSLQEERNINEAIANEILMRVTAFRVFILVVINLNIE
jgi:hypothetical protein